MPAEIDETPFLLSSSSAPGSSSHVSESQGAYIRQVREYSPPPPVTAGTGLFYMG